MWRSRWMGLQRLYRPEGDAGAGSGGGAGDGAAGGSGAGAGGGSGGTGRSFTQQEVNAMVQDRLRRERRAWAEEIGGDGAVDELKQLRADKAERERKEQEQDRNYQAALQSQQKNFDTEKEKWGKERHEWFTELKKDRVRGRVVAAAATTAAGQLRAIKPEQVADLLENRRVVLDEKTRQPIVIDEDGNPEYENGKPRAIESLVQEFLKENPHLAEASGTKATGAKGGATTQGGEGTETGTLADSQELQQARDKYKQLHEQAQKSGAIPDMVAANKAKQLLDDLERKAAAKKTA